MPRRRNKITPLQQRFAEEYLKDLNGSAAVLRAGFKTKHPDDIASQLLSKPHVRALIEELKAARRKEAHVEATDVLQELMRMSFSDMGDILDFSGLQPRLRPANQIPLSARRAISSMKVKRLVEGRGEDAREVEVIEFKLWDKNTAIDKLFRHLGLAAPEKHDHDHTVRDGGVAPPSAEQLRKLPREELLRLYHQASGEAPGAQP